MHNNAGNHAAEGNTAKSDPKAEVGVVASLRNIRLGRNERYGLTAVLNVGMSGKFRAVTVECFKNDKVGLLGDFTAAKGEADGDLAA